MALMTLSGNKQTADNNPILLYDAMIQSGDIIACEKIRRTYEHLADRVRHGSDRFHYDPFRAQHIINFHEKYLRHSKGRWGGKKIKLELWQKAMYAAGYGFVDDDDLRQYQRIILIIGKKNGKSFMSSGCGLYHLTADGEAGAEVYSVATKKDQAKIIWDESRRMRNKSPALRKRTRSTVSGLFFDAADGVYKPLAADANTLDGLNVSCALMDEFHQWRHGRRLYDIIADGVSSREEPMILMTSTAGTVREDIYDDIYQECSMIISGYTDPEGFQDERTLPLIYELDKREEWTDPNMWIKANPNLGVSKSITYLEESVERAKANPKLVRNLVCKEFNIRETEQTSLFNLDEIENKTKFKFTSDSFVVTNEDGTVETFPRPDYAVGGFDLSVRGDLTAAVVIFSYPDDDRLFCIPMFWMPADVLEDHIKSDAVPYDKWAEQGHLRICPGNQIDYKMVRDWFIEIRDKLDIYLPWIGYDPAYSAYLVDDLAQEFGENSMIPVRQGFMTLGMPMATIIKKFKAKQVCYNNNPLMKFNLICVTAEEDRNGNLMPSKRQRANQRIDGFSALLDAWTVMENNMDTYQSMV